MRLNRENARKFGIVSLSMKPDDILMWSHYSNGHSGFCIGFDSQVLKDCSGGDFLPVDYPKDNKFPSHNPLESQENLYEFMKKFIGTKSSHWKYEHEYRLFIIDINQRCVELPKEAFKQIIFGAKMTDKLKVEKACWLKANFPNIEIYEAKIDKEVFKLNLNRVSLVS